MAELSWRTSLPTTVLDQMQDGLLKQTYRGLSFLKSPLDVGLYLQLFERLEPRTIIEIGSKAGGSALWFADSMSARNRQLPIHVVSVDLVPPAVFDPRITFIEGDALNLGDSDLGETIRNLPRPWLVVEDSAHTFEACNAVIDFFDDKLMPGDWLVIEDGNLSFFSGDLYSQFHDGPNRSVRALLEQKPDRFRVAHELSDLYGLNATWNPNGWLERIAAVQTPAVPTPALHTLGLPTPTLHTLGVPTPAPTPALHTLGVPTPALADTPVKRELDGSAANNVMSLGRPYLDVLRQVHELVQPRGYLEIGVRHGDSLALAQCPAIAIDPEPLVTAVPARVRLVRGTSDEFFDMNGTDKLDIEVDLAFIDGMHLFEFVLRDFDAIEQLANANTVVVVDDIFPNLQIQGQRERETNVWMGDVWKIVECLRTWRPDLSLTLIDSSPSGLLLVSGLKPGNTVLSDAYDSIVSERLSIERVPDAVLARHGSIDPSRPEFGTTLSALLHLSDPRPDDTQ